MVSAEIDIKIWLPRRRGGDGDGSHWKNGPKVTHIHPPHGNVSLNSTSPWGGAQLNSADQHQHIVSNAIREGWR